jgi:hypothetical protein
LRGLGGVDFMGSVDFELLLLLSASVLILSFPCSSELFLALLCHFAWLRRFSCSLLAFMGFPSSR